VTQSYALAFETIPHDRRGRRGSKRRHMPFFQSLLPLADEITGGRIKICAHNPQMGGTHHIFATKSQAGPLHGETVPSRTEKALLSNCG